MAGSAVILASGSGHETSRPSSVAAFAWCLRQVSRYSDLVGRYGSSLYQVSVSATATTLKVACFRCVACIT